MRCCIQKGFQTNSQDYVERERPTRLAALGAYDFMRLSKRYFTSLESLDISFLRHGPDHSKVKRLVMNDKAC